MNVCSYYLICSILSYSFIIVMNQITKWVQNIYCFNLNKSLLNALLCYGLIYVRCVHLDIHQYSYIHIEKKHLATVNTDGMGS